MENEFENRNLLFNLTQRKSFIERYFLFLTQKNIPYFISGPIMLLILYIIIQGSIYFLTSGQIYPFDFNNMFFIRDLIAIFTLTPAYLFFIRKLRFLPLDLKDYLNENDQEIYKFFDRIFNKVFSNKKMILTGLLFSSFYFGILVFYILTNYYSFGFFIERLIGVVGVFLVGSLASQLFYILKGFMDEVKVLRLKISALYLGLEPIATIGSIGAIGWIVGVTLIMLPVFAYGLNPKSIYWYIFFYGILYSLGLIVFIFLTFGFHKGMVRAKREYLRQFAGVVNKNFVMATEDIESEKGKARLESWLTYMETYETIIRAKEWPFNISSFRDLILSYILPIILSILGLNG